MTNSDYAYSQGLALLNPREATVGLFFTIVQTSEAGTTLRIAPKQIRTFVWQWRLV